MKFEKVSFKQYCTDCGYTDKFGANLIERLREEYNDIELPKQGSQGSNGMDFYLPFDISLEPKEKLKIPTGIRWVSDFKTNTPSHKKLWIIPRSGLGSKHRLNLANTIADIDEDYFLSENEGHIILFIVNNGTERIILNRSRAFMQGCISDYYICEGAESDNVRDGGFGSSDQLTNQPTN